MFEKDWMVVGTASHDFGSFRALMDSRVKMCADSLSYSPRRVKFVRENLKSLLIKNAPLFHHRVVCKYFDSF